MAGPETLMGALGFSRETGRLYERIRPFSGKSLDDIATSMELEPGQLESELSELIVNGVVREVDGIVYVLSPTDAVTRLVADLATTAEVAHTQLLEISRALPYLAGATAKVPSPVAMHEEPLDGEVIAQTNLPDVVESLVGNARGDLSWIRPTQADARNEEQLLDVVRDAVADGRRCRGIYPVTALRDAPLAMAERARAGEEVRVLPEIPIRLMVVGTTHALFPDSLGTAESTRMVVRQSGLVGAATLIFDLLWARAATVAEFSPGSADGGTQRRFLLEQLATGAQDEQIARRLGISLRTVRRRIAEVLDELDASSRFQAGVEAIRRGWL